MVALACLPLVLIISSCLPSLTTSQAVVAMGSFSAEFSLSLTYKGQKLDFSVLLSVIQGKLDQSLFSLIPPALQPLVPPELAAALKNETVLELKAELQAALQVLKTVADPKELHEQLKKVMPKTVEVLKQLAKVIKDLALKFWYSLSEADRQLLTQLAMQVKDTAMAIFAILKQKYEMLAPDTKIMIQASITVVVPPLQAIFDLPVVKAALA